MSFSLWDDWGFQQKGMQVHRLEQMTLHCKQELITYLLGCDSHKICSIDYGMVLMRPRLRTPCWLQGQSSVLFSDLWWQERLGKYTSCWARMHRYCRWSRSLHFCWSFTLKTQTSQWLLQQTLYKHTYWCELTPNAFTFFFVDTSFTHLLNVVLTFN